MFKKLIVIFLCVGLILTIAGFIVIKGNVKKIVDTFNNDEDYQLVTKSGSESINEVNLHLLNKHVIFYQSENEDYIINYYESEKDKINFTIENGKLTLKNVRKNFIFFNYTSKKIRNVEIYLPTSFQGKVDINLSSGKINLENYHLSSLDIDVTSGNINLNNVEVEGNVKIDITSGNVHIDNLNASNFDYEGTSGNITIINSQIINEAQLSMTSGDIDIKDTTIPTIDLKSTSGDIDLYNITSSNIDVNVTSGDADLTIFGDHTDYQVYINVTSGKVLYQGLKVSNQIINPSGAKSIKLKLTSGDGSIDFLEGE